MEYQIKSNIVKVMVVHILMLIGIWVIAFIIIRLVASMLGDIDIGAGLEILNLSLPTGGQMASVAISVGTVLSIGWTLMKYLKYAFTSIKFDETQISLFIMNGLDKKNTSFPLENISKIVYEEDIIGKVLGCKIIKLEATGSESFSLVMDYVDKGKEWVESIQNMVNQRRSNTNYDYR